MEDAITIAGEFAGAETQFYGVYDGHGGRDVSSMLSQQLHVHFARQLEAAHWRDTVSSENVSLVTIVEVLSDSFKHAITEMNQEALANERWGGQGSTLAAVGIYGSVLIAANVGDSRVLLVGAGFRSDEAPENHRKRHRKKLRKEAEEAGFTWAKHGTCCCLTIDHKISDPNEAAQVVARGGEIVKGRVGGTLELSRSIGDGFVAQWISAEPNIHAACFRAGQKLILACDGVFDVLTNAEVAALWEEGMRPGEAANRIRDVATERGSKDNITVLCVDLARKDGVKT